MINIFIIFLSEDLDGGRSKKKKPSVQRPSVSCDDFQLDGLEALLGREVSQQQGLQIKEIFCAQSKNFKNQTSVKQECQELRSMLDRGSKSRGMDDVEPVCSSQKSGGQEFLAISGGIFWGTIVVSTAAWVFYKTCVKK